MLNDLLDLNDIMLLPPLEWSIETLLPRRGVSIIAGDAKAGKSVIVLDNLLRGVQGRAAFGRFNQQFQRVLVVNIEGRHQGIKMRDPMFAFVAPEVRKKIFISAGPAHVTYETGKINHLAVQAISDRIKQAEIDLVVLDPLVSFHTADENNSQQMVAVLDAVRDIAEKTNSAFLIIHHARKVPAPMGNTSPKEALNAAIEQGGAMMRGASGIFGAVDSAILAWKMGRDRLLTFVARYALPGANLEPCQMRMDKLTMRMYPVLVEEGNIPDPKEWLLDNEPDWNRYAMVFDVGPQGVETAKRYVGT